MDTLSEDFGFDKTQMIVIFSGRQGFHLWLPSVKSLFRNKWQFSPRVVMRFETELRITIAEYLTLIKEKKRKKTVKGKTFETHIVSPNYKSTKSIPKNLLARIRNQVFSNLVLNSLEVVRKEIKNIPEAKWNEAYEAMLNGSSGWKTFDEMTKLYSDKKKDAIQQKIMELRYPRYDVVATKDVHRIMKIPDSVDGSTGNLCSIVEDISSFSFDNLIHIKNF